VLCRRTLIISLISVNHHSRELHFFTISGTRAVSNLVGIYAFGQTIGTIVDRSQHQQSIGLTNAESLNCWLRLTGILLNLASGSGTTAVNKIVQEGDSVSLTTEFALKSVTVSSCIVDAIAVTSGLTDIIKKIVDKEKIASLDIFQFTSAVLFFTNSLISAHEAFTLIDSIGKNSTINFSHDSGPIRNQTSEIVKHTASCKDIAQIVSGCSSTVRFTGVCHDVRSKLFEITNGWRAGLISESNYKYDLEHLVDTYWNCWNEEMADVAEKICIALGVKNWLEMLGVQREHIRRAAGTVITERIILSNIVTTGTSCLHSQVGSGNSDVGGSSRIDNGASSFVYEEMARSVSYDNEVIHILVECVHRQICTAPEKLPEYMTLICKFVKSEFQEEKSRYDKTYEVVRDYMSVDEFYNKLGIFGNPNNYFIIIRHRPCHLFTSHAAWPIINT
jgi:hypothetical protein